MLLSINVVNLVPKNHNIQYIYDYTPDSYLAH